MAEYCFLLHLSLKFCGIRENQYDASVKSVCGICLFHMNSVSLVISTVGLKVLVEYNTYERTQLFLIETQC